MSQVLLRCPRCRRVRFAPLQVLEQLQRVHRLVDRCLGRLEVARG